MQNSQEDTPNINNFNKELLELLCQDDKSNNENICLISNTPLQENFVKLCCGHTFNYTPIFNEIKYQKKNPHHYETQKLSSYQIKCPYCRTIQNGLLPYYENSIKCNWVNWPIKYQYKPNNCLYKYISGKRKGKTCSKSCFKKYCINHGKIIKNRLEKQKEKEKSTNNTLTTYILNHQNLIIKPACSYKFKRGKKKGTPCSCKKIYKDDLCKTHHKQLKLKMEKQLHLEVLKSKITPILCKQTWIPAGVQNTVITI
jgi:hypothetical protein